MKFTIRGLKSGTYPVHLRSGAESMDLTPFHGAISADGELTVNEQFDFALHIGGDGSFICDRCAVEFERRIETDLHIVYTDELSSSDETLYEHIVDFQDTPVVDLSEDVHDALLLAIPMKNLCRPDCQGIPLTALEREEDENTSILKALYDKLASEETEGK
jgi:uncharacterized metal-binding protein YceD (DUF177 family)